MGWNPFTRRKRGGQVVHVVPFPIEDITNDPGRIAKRLEQTIEEARDVPPYDPGRVMDESRKTIAFWFVGAFIMIIGLVLILTPTYNAIVFNKARVVVEETTYQPLDVEKLLATIGTLLGTPLGFVVGYYFKEEHAGKGNQAPK